MSGTAASIQVSRRLPPPIGCEEMTAISKQNRIRSRGYRGLPIYGELPSFNMPICVSRASFLKDIKMLGVLPYIHERGVSIEARAANLPPSSFGEVPPLAKLISGPSTRFNGRSESP